MRPPPRPRNVPLGFNMTPMIDVVFNLIVFFLVASHFSSAEPGADVALPSASQATEVNQEPHRLIVTVMPSGEWRVAGNATEPAKIEEMIREGRRTSPGSFAVHIRGDRSVPYRFIEPLLTASARAGVVSQIFFHVDPR